MIWVVAGLLGLFALAAGKSIFDFREGQSAGAGAPSKEDDPKPLLTPGTKATPLPACKQGMTFCTQEYAPESCVVEVGGTRYEASGSNGCQAVQALLSKVCEAGIGVIPGEAVPSLRCAAAAGTGTNE